MGRLIERSKRVPLRLQVVMSGDDVSGRRFTETTSSLNLSGGGICLESGRRLGVGSRLVLRIAVPPALRRHFGGHDTYSTRAVVCRVEPFTAEGRTRVGARFLGGVL
jgi:hypothetical protein